MQQIPGFVGPSYKLDSPNFAVEECINLYLQVKEHPTGKLMRLKHAPGFAVLEEVTGRNRGLYLTSKDRAFAVNGSTLYEISESGAATSRGTLRTSTGRVSMADNGVELAIVDGEYGYILNMDSNAFAAISDPDMPRASHVGFLDGMFIFNDVDTQQFYVSALYAGGTIDSLDFASSEGLPDYLRAIVVSQREAVLFNEFSTEIWFNSGDGDFPLARNGNAFIEYGISARHSACKADNSVYWLSKDTNGEAMVMRLEGYSAKRVSSFAVEYDLQQYADLSEATAWSYQMGGETFYVLSVPEMPHSWQLNVSTGLWNKLQSRNGTNEIRFRAENHIVFGGRHIVGDFENGNLYELSPTAYDHNGAPKVCKRRMMHPTLDRKRVNYEAFELEMETGVGTATLDPQVMLRFSDDAGHTWSNEEWVSAGKVGEYSKRARWTRLGQARERVFEVTISDAVPVSITGAWIQTSKGSH